MNGPARIRLWRKIQETRKSRKRKAGRANTGHYLGSSCLDTSTKHCVLRIRRAVVLAYAVVHFAGDVMEGLHDNNAEHGGCWSEATAGTQANGSEAGTGDGRSQFPGVEIPRAALACLACSGKRPSCACELELRACKDGWD